MNPAQLGQKVKAQYPQYAGLSDIEVGSKVLKKYPQYASSTNFNDPAYLGDQLKEAGAQLPQIGIGAAKSVAQTFEAANPLETMNKMAGATKDWTGQSFDQKNAALSPSNPQQKAGEWAGTVAQAFLPVPKAPAAVVLKDVPEVASALGATKKVSEAVTKVQDKAITNLESSYQDWFGATKAGARRVAKNEARTTALNQAGTTGKTAARSLAEMRIVPATTGTKFTTIEQVGQIRQALRPLNDVLTTAIGQARYATAPASVDSLKAGALSRINEMQMPEGERESLLSEVNAEFGRLQKKYGNSMSLGDMQKEKPAYWGDVKFDSTRPFKRDAYYQVAKSFQQGIEESATKAGYEDVAQLNREIGDRLEAAKQLESLDGQTLKHGRLGRLTFMAVGSTFGHTPLGKVMGMLGGDIAAQVLMDASVSNPAKRLILNSIEEKDPEAYKATLDWLAKQGMEQSERLALPPASAIYQPPTQGGSPFTPNQILSAPPILKSGLPPTE